MQAHFKKLFMICIIILNCTLLVACGTRKNFIIDSDPKGALIIQHKNPLLEESYPWSLEYVGETPTQGSALFIGSIDSIFFTAEKRGYNSSTQKITKESEISNITFNLKKIDGAPDKTFNKDKLHSVKFVLLPAYAEVMIRSGVGRLDKIEYSPQLSKKVTEEFSSELIRAFNNSQSKQVSVLNESMNKDWEAISGEVKTYVLKLNFKRLNYYSLPPYINDNVAGFISFSMGINGQTGNDASYLLYIWAKCISESKGRKIGNIFVGTAAAAHSQVVRGSYYDPSAFNPDSGTMVVMYVIDANTSEVLYIEPRDFGYDITDSDDLNKLADILGGFPNINKKK